MTLGKRWIYTLDGQVASLSQGQHTESDNHRHVTVHTCQQSFKGEPLQHCASLKDTLSPKLFIVLL